MTHLRPEFVEYMPERIDDGVLYISQRYEIALHNCCCGCGEEVATPLTATEWRLTVEGNAISLYPSIGNHDFACKSHYWIERNQVRWAGAMTPAQIDAGRAYDRYLKRGNAEARGASDLVRVRRFFGWLQSLFARLFR